MCVDRMNRRQKISTPEEVLVVVTSRSQSFQIFLYFAIQNEPCYVCLYCNSQKQT